MFPLHRPSRTRATRRWSRCWSATPRNAPSPRARGPQNVPRARGPWSPGTRRSQAVHLSVFTTPKGRAHHRGGSRSERLASCRFPRFPAASSSWPDGRARPVTPPSRSASSLAHPSRCRGGLCSARPPDWRETAWGAVSLRPWEGVRPTPATHRFHFQRRLLVSRCTPARLAPRVRELPSPTSGSPLRRAATFGSRVVCGSPPVSTVPLTFRRQPRGLDTFPEQTSGEMPTSTRPAEAFLARFRVVVPCVPSPKGLRPSFSGLRVRELMPPPARRAPSTCPEGPVARPVRRLLSVSAVLAAHGEIRGPSVPCPGS